MSVESNKIGIDEFVDWCKKADTKVMAAVNLGTGTPRDAGYMLEYCNHPSGTYWSDLRIKNGHKDPHDIKIWCLGNEMDGPWQTCALSAVDYGKKAREAAKIMKWVDPGIELVVCGSSGPLLDTYPEWDRIVLEHTYEQVDYISMHRYYENEGDVQSFLAAFADMDNFIKTVAATCDYVKAKTRSKKRMKISFDEWNVWYIKKQTRVPWAEAPAILEDQYSLLDALVFGGMLCTLLNNADRVQMACLAQLVNIIAPIFTEQGGRVLKQAIYYPFQQVSLYGRGTALKTITSSPEITTKAYGEVTALNTAATYERATGEITVFALNASCEADIELKMDLRSFGRVRMIEHTILAGPDLFQKNTFAAPLAVIPKKADIPSGENMFAIVLPKLSWHVFRLKAMV
jgi:alpha-N-arabinofuranosidase